MRPTKEQPPDNNMTANEGRQPSRTYDANSTPLAGGAGSVANTLWTGATAVGNYLWSFWSPPAQTTSQIEGMGRMSTACVDDRHSGLSGASPRVAHHRASSNPEKLSSVSVLEDEDYGVRLVGRSITGEDALLTDPIIKKIHAALPPRFRLCTTWKLIYSTPEHGFSLSTLFNQCRTQDGPCLLIVRDDNGALFGVFSTESWQPHFVHYGSGECFLWRLLDDGKIKKYASTGKNSFFMLSDATYLAAGCGDGKFGFWLDEELLNGLSQQVPTFDNDCLADSEKFKCVNLEVWGLDMTPLE